MNYYRHFGLFYCLEKMANVSIAAELTGRKISKNDGVWHLNTCAKFHYHQLSIRGFGGVYILALYWPLSQCNAEASLAEFTVHNSYARPLQLAN